jgi:glycosyltransferase involved in cell wall biosynthesis
MKILMTSYEFPPVGGGGGQVAKTLAMKVAALGDEVDLITMGYRGLPRFERHDRMVIHRVPSLRRDLRYCSVPAAASYLACAMPILPRLLRERRYDIVHSHFIFPDGWLGLYASWMADAPLILTPHGTDVPGHNPHRVRVLHECLKPTWRLITSRATRIVCPSGILESRVKQANTNARTTVIPNGLDPDRFDAASPKTRRVLVVARLVESKGVQFLLRALQGFRSDYEVVVVGDGPYGDDLKKLSRELSVRVTFTGWLDNDSAELKRLFETSRIFAFPSLAENCPITLLEAMAAGCAIVTTHGTGCAEVVGDAALLVPPRDPSAIRTALDQLAGRPDLMDALGAAARARVERSFSWEHVVDMYREIYRSHAGDA